MKKITVTTCVPTGGGFSTLEEKWEVVKELLNVAGAQSPDLVVLPEGLNHVGPQSYAEAAIEVPGPQSEMFAHWAAEHHSYVLLPVFERYRGRLRNSAVLIDRKGEVEGRYFKTYPTIGELEVGVVPGEGAVALQTDFGPMGVAICYDANFMSLFAQYEELGVRLICFVSEFSAGSLLNAYAVHHGYHIVSSYAAESRFIDPAGRTVAWTGLRIETVRAGHLPVLLTRTIDLDTLQVHLDEISPFLKELLAERAEDVSFEVVQSEGFVLLRTLKEDLPVRALLNEMGLETRQEYLKRAAGLRDERLKAIETG